MGFRLPSLNPSKAVFLKSYTKSALYSSLLVLRVVDIKLIRFPIIVARFILHFAPDIKPNKIHFPSKLNSSRVC